MINHYVVKEAEKALTDFFPEKELCGIKILAGLSGGADSVTLVAVLHILSAKYGFSVSACHINHMIRGEEADRDENFAMELCRKLEIPFYTKKFDVPRIAKESGKGLEEAARDVRYGYFEELCKSGIAGFIATAHTASDNSETVLLNIIRGCGISGICGIPARRGRIIRPLLRLSREDIEKFLADYGMDYVTDSTNLLDDCSRNIIRHRVIPELCGLNPALHRQISKLSEIAFAENAYLDKIASDCRTDSISQLAKLDKVILSRVIGMMYREKCGNNPGAVHIDMLCREIYKAAASNCGELKKFDLPGGICAKFECGRLLYISESDEKTLFSEYDIELSEGLTPICDGKMLVLCQKNAENNKESCEKIMYNQNIYSLFMESRLFSDIIKGKIRLRSGLPGDRIRISGMSKDIKKMYSTKKIPTDIRKYLPRLVDDGSGEIIALPYVGVCDSQYEVSDMADISVSLYILYDKE